MIRAAWDLMTGNLWRAGAIGAGALAAGLAIALLLANARIDVEVAKRKAAAADLHAAALQMQKFAADVRAASAVATAAALQNARDVEAAQAAVSEGVARNVQDRLGSIDARVDGLRRQIAGNGGRGAEAADMPGPADPAGRAYAAAADAGLLAVDPATLGECQRNTERLLGWQDWYRDVAALPRTPVP
jgi:hypothetical protein